MRDTTTPATNDASGGSPHQTAGGERTLLEVLRSLMVSYIADEREANQWRRSSHWNDAPHVVRMGLLMRLNFLENEIRDYLQQLGGLAAAW